MKGSVTEEVEQRQTAYSSAIQYYNKSTDLLETCSATWTGKAFLTFLMTPHDLETINNFFNNAIQTDTKDPPSNVLAFLGKALVLLHMRKYNEALQFYKKALFINPNLPGYVRLGFGVCYYQLGQYDKARLAFERVLEMETTNIYAFIGLALLKFGELQKKIQDGVKEGVEEILGDIHDNLSKASTIDPTSPLVLYHLSTYSFYAGDYETSRKYAFDALERVKNEQIAQTSGGNSNNKDMSSSQTTHSHFRSSLLYQVGKTYHLQHDYEKAHIFYEQSKTLHEKNVLALVGYAQMSLYKHDYEKAMPPLQIAHTLFPKNFDVLRLLGSAYHLLNKDAEALSFLQKAIDISANDFELLLEYAEVAEKTRKYQAAYLAYKRTVKIMTELHKVSEEEVPYEIMNNLGVVCLKMRKYDEAEAYWQRAIQNQIRLTTSPPPSSSPPTPYPPSLLTLHYNLSFLYECQGKFMKCLEKLQEIIHFYPKYVDGKSRTQQRTTSCSVCNYVMCFSHFFSAHLRLGYIYQLSGNLLEAKSCFERASKLKEQNPTAYSLLGNWHIAQGDVEQGAKCFDSILTKFAGGEEFKRDNYAKLSLGNLQVWKVHQKYRKELQNPAHNPAELQRTYMQQYKDAAAFYDSVLRKDPHNIYAGHGLGCVLAEQGKYNEAKEIFTTVRENLIKSDGHAQGSSHEIWPDVWCNMGHVYVQMGLYVQAVKMVSTAISRDNMLRLMFVC